MNRRAMTKTIATLAATTLFCALLGACSGKGTAPAAEMQGADLAGASIGGPFTLIDKNGKSVSWGDFAGKYVIVYFGYTFCHDACPTDVGVMTQGLARFARAAPARAEKIQPIFISVDPERDTPAKVGEFTAAFSPRLIGLTGTRAQVDGVIKAFRVYAAKGKETSGGYLMDHSRAAYLMGPDGAPIEALPVDKGAEAVAADLARAVQ